MNQGSVQNVMLNSCVVQNNCMHKQIFKSIFIFMLLTFSGRQKQIRMVISFTRGMKSLRIRHEIILRRPHIQLLLKQILLAGKRCRLLRPYFQNVLMWALKNVNKSRENEKLALKIHFTLPSLLRG